MKNKRNNSTTSEVTRFVNINFFYIADIADANGMSLYRRDVEVFKYE